MRILMLGGTRFVGRAIAEAAVGAGHQVSMVHRGSAGTGLVPGAQDIVIDRMDLNGLPDEHWDAVIDVSAYVPRAVRIARDALHGRVGRYCLVSSVSVYATEDSSGELLTGQITESSPLRSLPDPLTEEVNGETYGGLKVLCEQELAGMDSLIVRPTYVIGPRDYTGRFPWWVRRIGRGGSIVLPEPRDNSLQVIDSRDLAAFVIGALDSGLGDVFNIAGPEQPLTQESMVKRVAEVLGAGDLDPVWVSAAELEGAGAVLGQDYPLLGPPHITSRLMRVSNRAARDAGLRFRSLEESAGDVQAWMEADPEAPGAAAGTGPGMSPEREAQISAAIGGQDT